MQSATTVACSGNGIKRTASSALASDASSPGSSSTLSAAATTSGGGGAGGICKDEAESPPPPEKRSFIVIESPIKLETVSSAEDLDIKVLRIQNKNLSERLLQRQKLEADLRERIDQLQNRKAADDSKLCIVDRYWTQLDEDMRLMLERFDETASGFLEDESKSTNNKENNTGMAAAQTTAQQSLNQKAAAKSSVRQLLNKLNDWDRSELDDSLKDRVKFTTQTLSKLITNYEKLAKKNEFYFKEFLQSSNASSEHASAKLKELHDENIRLNDLITKCELKFHTHGLEKKQLEDKISQLENEMKEMSKRSGETEYELDRIRDKAFKLDRQLADTIIKLNNAQKIIQNNSTNNTTTTNNNNNNHLNNHCDQNGHIILPNNFNSGANSVQNNANVKLNEKAASLTDKQLSDMEFEMEQQRELANNRLHELEKLNVEYQSAVKQIEKLKAELKTIPETVIEQSSEYKMLQTKYSYIVNDNIRLKQALDETRQILEMTRTNFHRQLEQMEADELTQQKRLGNEMMQLEEQLCQVRKENDLLRIEYEQNMAANEQTGPINKEMRSLITTLQTNNKLLKSDNARCKKRFEEAQTDLERAKKHSTQLQSQVTQLQQQLVTSKREQPVNNEAVNESVTENNVTESNALHKKEDEETSTSAPGGPATVAPVSTSTSHKDSTSMQQRETRELKERNKRLQDMLKEARAILDAFSKSSASSMSSTPTSSKSSAGAAGVGGDETKAELKRTRELFEKLKSVMSSKSLTSSSPLPTGNSHHHSDETTPLPSTPTSAGHSASSSHGSSSGTSVDYLKKIRSLEENVKELHKSLSNKKQEEAALLNDMEITGQAFEDMQEQNIRLMQQLREKDDANFKLVSERIKLENVQKILKEEKEACLAQATTLQEQHESHLMVSKKLEEQIQQLSQKIVLLEKEVCQLHQACDNYKRQAIDNVQLIQELKLSSQKYLCQLKEAQSQIGEKSELLAAQTFTNKRAQEEIKHLQAKLERQKRFEMATNMDEVLREEIKEYKEQLRCPSCKIKQKDAVLTKCFHVFCYDCLQKRYDTRQRKCPKCNANFGANDFRKIYLS